MLNFENVPKCSWITIDTLGGRPLKYVLRSVLKIGIYSISLLLLSLSLVCELVVVRVWCA